MQRPILSPMNDGDVARLPSIRDVAAAAGVSVTTVSHAFSGARSVRGETRERVLQAAEELGYRADPRASGLRRKRSFIVGLLSDRMASSRHTAELVQGAQAVARARGSVVVTVDSGDDRETERLQVQSLLEHRVDGVLYAREFHQEVEVPSSLGDVPVVLVDARCPDRSLSSIVPDEKAIARVAVEHLLDHGHRRIAFATTLDDSPATCGRLDGYRATLTAAGIVPEEALVVASTSDAPGGRESGHTLLGLAEPPTAVFCFNDQIAMGVFQAAGTRGVLIPEDLSVVGVDDLEIVAEALDPPLTTVALPHHEMGTWAMTRLLDLVDGGDVTGPEQVELDSLLVERASVTAPRA